MSENCVLPEFDLDAAARIARVRFALEGPITALDGERDLNFLIEDPRGKFVFKIANLLESPALLECQHQVLRQLAAARVFERVALPLASRAGHDLEFVRDALDRQHACRVLPFIDGRMLAEIKTLNRPLLEDLGRRLAALDRALESFSHPALTRSLLWHMDRVGEIIDWYKPLLAQADARKLVDYFALQYRRRLAAHRHGLRRAVIHNDANRGNVLVDDSASSVVSIIDFGDMIESWLAVEVAIAAAYAMLEQADPFNCALDLIRGYQSAFALQRDEAEMVPEFIAMRLCMSICICAHQQRLEPGNAYLSVDAEAALALLEKLRTTKDGDFRGRVLAVCGFKA